MSGTGGETWARLLRRRELLAGLGGGAILGALSGCASAARPNEAQPSAASGGSTVSESVPLPAGSSGSSGSTVPLRFETPRVATDRITRLTVCTRPFRAAGPRLETEIVGRKTVVHNYGHGGSGWSLSWGSSTLAVAQALATGARDVGVIGCGALGLTSALLLQRAGVRVTIYAKDLPPNVRSSNATGLWTPDSRICYEDNATARFKEQWQQMARTSFATYQTLLGLPGFPVEFIDQYAIFDAADSDRHREAELAAATETRPQFAELQRELIPELMPRSAAFGPGTHTFGARYLRRNTLMMFNLTVYQRLLVGDFQANGGKLEIVEFHAPSDLAALREKTLINATGYGARALFGDHSLTPVRGQLARLIPEPEVRYGLYYKGVSMVPRRDGVVVQAVGTSDYFGFDDDSTLPDRAEAETAVNTIAGLFPPPTA